MPTTFEHLEHLRLAHADAIAYVEVCWNIRAGMGKMDDIAVAKINLGRAFARCDAAHVAYRKMWESYVTKP